MADVAGAAGLTQTGEGGFPPLVRYLLRNAFPSFSWSLGSFEGVCRSFSFIGKDPLTQSLLQCSSSSGKHSSTVTEWRMDPY